MKSIVYLSDFVGSEMSFLTLPNYFLTIFPNKLTCLSLAQP